MLKNKRILITQPAIRSINGSTVVTLELAQELSSLGALVTVYTCDLADPAKTIFRYHHIKVQTAIDQPDYKLSDFDYVWVHSQIIPPSLINHLTQKIPKKNPAFIFLHMSGMDWIPDEKPWIYDLENQLSSLSLFICEEVKTVNSPFLNAKIPTGFFRNPAPINFYDRSIKPHPKLEKLLIVSSHPPKEVLEAKEILKSKHHLKVDILGEAQEKYELFSKKLLEQYDAVLTIAKTVPYCLISGTPVYVYDAFGGGPGWLNEKNFEEAKLRNFSGYQNSQYPNYEGSVFHPKTANEIVTDLISGYPASLTYHQSHLDDFLPDFSITSALPPLLTNLKSRPIKTLPKDYAASVIAAQIFADDKFKTGGLLYDKDQTIISLTQEKRRLIKENENLKQSNLDLNDYKKKAEKVFQSKAYRIFDTTIKPYKKLKSFKSHH